MTIRKLPPNIKKAVNIYDEFERINNEKLEMVQIRAEKEKVKKIKPVVPPKIRKIKKIEPIKTVKKKEKKEPKPRIRSDLPVLVKKVVSEENIIYFAGLFDGAGGCGVYKISGRYIPQLRFSFPDPHVGVFIREHYNCFSLLYVKHYKNFICRTCNPLQIIYFLEDISPYLTSDYNIELATSFINLCQLLIDKDMEKFEEKLLAFEEFKKSNYDLANLEKDNIKLNSREESKKKKAEKRED